MAIRNSIPSTVLHEFRLKLRRGLTSWDVYSMGESVEDAFARFSARMQNRDGGSSGIEFVEGGLANPHANSGS